MSYVWKDGKEKRRDLTAYPLKKEISLISPLHLSYLTINQRSQLSTGAGQIKQLNKLFDEIYGYDKSPCAYVRYHVTQIIKRYESQNRSDILEESWLRSCGQMYDMLSEPLLDFEAISDGVMSLLPTELAKEYQNQRDKKISQGGNETFRQKIFKKMITDNFDEFKDGRWKEDLPVLDHNQFSGTKKLMRILFPEDPNQPPVYDYWGDLDCYGLDVNIWSKIGAILFTSLCWNGYLFSKDQYTNFAEQNRHVQHYSKRQQEKAALGVMESLAFRGALNTLLKSSIMALFVSAGYMYPIVYCENDSTLMSLSMAPGLGFAAGMVTSFKFENSLNFNSTITLGTQLKALIKIPLYIYQSLFNKTWQRTWKSTHIKSGNMQSFGNAEFRPIPRTPLGRDLKVFIDPRNNRGRNILFVGSIFLVVYTYVITFIQNRDAMSAAVFKKYNVVAPLEGSEEFVEKAQSIFNLNDSTLAPFLSPKEFWKSLPEDYMQRPHNLSQTEDRIRHVERLNLFLESLFPGDSNVTEYGYEFEKNIFKTQAAKSYIYPS